MPSRCSSVVSRPAERLRRRPRLRGQVWGLGLSEAFPHAAEVGRVLADEELDGEVEGVQRARERSELRLIELEPHDLEDAELDAVDADGAVVLQVGEHEAERQRQRRFYNGLPGLPAGIGRSAQDAVCHALGPSSQLSQGGASSPGHGDDAVAQDAQRHAPDPFDEVSQGCAPFSERGYGMGTMPLRRARAIALAERTITRPRSAPATALRARPALRGSLPSAMRTKPAQTTAKTARPAAT